MIKKTVLLTLILSLTITLSFAQKLYESVETYIEEKATEYAKDYPGVSISVIKGDSFLWKKTFGEADIGNDIPVTSDTKFNIYSTSKFITGLAYLKLLKEGKISLNQKINTIDSDLPKVYEGITINHLLTHTSGIRHYEGKKDWINFGNLSCESPREAMEYFINDPLKAKPGEKEVYTTFGLVVASHILEKVTGKSYQEAINNLLPFSSTLELDGSNKTKATPYIKKGKKFTVYPNLNAVCKYGGGGFIATSDQLAEAGQMLFNGEIAPLNEIKNLFKNQWEEGENSGVAFATGAGIANESFGQPDVLYVALGGGSPGGRSYLFIVADLEIVVAITANLEGDGEDAYKLALDIVKKIEGIE